MRLLPVIALLSGGCFAAAGPTIGIVVPEGRRTIGWQASGSVLSFGQSFAADGWRRRSFFVFEPRLGRPLGSSEDNFVGAGLSLGLRWDAAAEPAGAQETAFIAGGFAGGGRFITGTDNGGDPAPYLSISLGIRGDEIYLAPKVGFFVPPELDFNVSVH
jgi:hypothetical protein